MYYSQHTEWTLRVASSVHDSHTVELLIRLEMLLAAAGPSNRSARKNAPENPIKNTKKMARNLFKSLFKMMKSV